MEFIDLPSQGIIDYNFINCVYWDIDLTSLSMMLYHFHKAVSDNYGKCFLDGSHPHSIGLAKEFVQIFSSYVTEKSKWMRAGQPNTLFQHLASYISHFCLWALQCQDVTCLQDIIHVECINATWNYRRISTLQLLFSGCAALSGGCMMLEWLWGDTPCPRANGKASARW